MEKEMATHSSILAWRISWTEEPGRVGHNLATKPPPPLYICICKNIHIYVYARIYTYTHLHTTKQRVALIYCDVTILSTKIKPK